MGTYSIAETGVILLFHLVDDYLSILILNIKSYSNVAWYHLAPQLAFYNKMCPKSDCLLTYSSDFFSDIHWDKAFNYVTT